MKSNFKVRTKAIVNNESWYTISCKKEVSIWLRTSFCEQEDKQWFQNIDEKWHINYNVFDVHEKIYILLALRWA